MTTSQRPYLRSLAQKEPGTVHVGKAGITEAVVSSVLDAFNGRELVKGRVLESSLLSAREAQDALCEACGAEGVQCIGNVFSMYKKNLKNPKIVLPK